MEDRQPTITPTISGMMNSLIEADTMMHSGTITTSVVSEVIMVLLRVWLRLRSMLVSLLSLLYIRLFSLILSKITMVSLMEYPTSVRIAAINGLLTVNPNIA